MSLFALPVVTCFGLGTWQLYRRGKKVEEMKERAWRMTRPPIGIAELSCCLASEADECDCEYRRVRLLGRFDEGRALLLGPRPKSGDKGTVESGYEVIAPLTLHDGSQVLVNRGWVPGHDRAAAWPAFEEDATAATAAASALATPPEEAEEAPSGWLNFWPFKGRASSGGMAGEAWVRGVDVAVNGVVRRDEKVGWGVPGNDPATGFWSTVDRRAMAAALGLPRESTPYVQAAYNREGGGGSEEEDALAEALLRAAEAPGARPKPVPRRWSEFMQWKTTPEIHAVYAATWYTLFLGTALIFRRRVWGVGGALSRRRIVDTLPHT